MRAEAGALVGGRYRLTSPVAAGGMGEVWRATDEVLARTVAVKLLRSELVADPGFLERFRTEARHSARLAHPCIAATYDYGESEGTAWLVMELVPGEPLSELLAREGALEPRRAMALVAHAAQGLSAAHAAGLVHRDVKPGNLLVTPTGGVKVTDFGIARAVAEAPLTATGQVMGTAAYLSPEQATGRRDITAAADVYALGVVAHELLAGSRPFTGDSQVAIALAQVNDPPPPLPETVPASARALVTACLEKEPLARPQDAGVVAQVAERISAGDDAGALALLGRATAAAGAGATALLGAAAPTAAATVLAAAAPGTAPGPVAAAPATPVAPATAVAGAPVEGAPPARGVGADARPHRRLTVPLLGLLAVLVVVAAAFALARPDAGGPDPAAPPSVAPTAEAPATPRSPSADEDQGSGAGSDPDSDSDEEPEEEVPPGDGAPAPQPTPSTTPTTTPEEEPSGTSTGPAPTGTATSSPSVDPSASTSPTASSPPPAAGSAPVTPTAPTPKSPSASATPAGSTSTASVSPTGTAAAVVAGTVVGEQDEDRDGIA